VAQNLTSESVSVSADGWSVTKGDWRRRRREATEPCNMTELEVDGRAPAGGVERDGLVGLAVRVVAACVADGEDGVVRVESHPRRPLEWANALLQVHPQLWAIVGEPSEAAGRVWARGQTWPLPAHRPSPDRTALVPRPTPNVA